MIVIGLTGGIASGKTTVSQILAQLGAVVLNADKVGHEALKLPEIRQQIIDSFGQGVLLPSGEVDRNRLGDIVFNDGEALEKLNGIMHPPMYRMVEERIENLRKQNVKMVVLEAALLFEAGWSNLVDEIWVTVAPKSTALRRLQNEKGLTKAQALARIGAQLSSEERAKHADAVINTDCDLSEVKKKVKELWSRAYHE